MSEEPATPVLRLKPRLRAEGTPATAEPPSQSENAHSEAASAAVAVAPPVASSAGGMSLKLRPRTGVAGETVLPNPTPAPSTAPAPAAPSMVAPVAAMPAPALAVSAPAPTAALPSTPPAPTAPISAAVSAPVVSVASAIASANTVKTPAVAAIAPTPVSESVITPPAPAVDASRFKLKPRAVGTDGPPPAVPPGGVSTKPMVAALPPLPPVLPSTGAAQPSPALAAVAALPKLTAAVPPPPPGTAPTDLSANVSHPSTARLTAPSLSSGVDRPENTRAFKAGIWAVTVLVIVVVGGGAVLAYRYLQPKDESAVPIATTRPVIPAAKIAAPEPERAESVNEPVEPVVASPQSLPGKMVGKARDVIAARDQSGQVSGVGEILGDTPELPPAVRPKAPPTTSSGAISDRNTPLDASTPPPETVVDKPAAPPPGIAFRTYVANLRVSGVFQGEPGRALLNGRTIRIGEMADNTLGIRLSGLDYERKVLFFEDSAGSTMQRRY